MKKEFTKQLLSGLKDFLKPLGYKKSGNNFSFQKNDLVFFIQLQKSMDSDADSIKFTINTTILSVPLFQSTQEGKPAYLYSHWFKRIGCYTSPAYDKWWTITKETDVLPALKEVCSIIQSTILPQLESYSLTSDLIKEWEGGICVGLTDGQRKTTWKWLKLFENALFRKDIT